MIKNVNANKNYGWNKISIRMMKLCCEAIATSLKLIFQSMIQEGVPIYW